ncbi:MAG: SirB2 family protein [Methylococcaceae bacterium]|nr:SirB2 family protein [Methylococcaceae bacterium]MDZ4156284.1 SirB2 family protein [Methylococcales bacterium]MDP2393404.1 SirB2 family protein [Methylococcaceae bacterium]MDP3019889.1 SirB2 family protein [Methylococcaceae bacterium]MDP3388702.1 SirB2 family protein [Methylococcaceae bacterium]
MIKILHLSFILLSIISFIGRVIISEIRPELLKVKIIKIAPHVINTFLLLTGFTLVFQGGWLAGDYGWIIGKFVVLLAYIGLGLLTLRAHGANKWLAFSAALACFIYIGIVAVTKNAWFFL